MIKIQPSGDYVQLIYVDPVQESVQQELKSDTDAFECSYDSDGKLFMQFGAMRFENPDPTDFTINGVAVIDAADFISKLNALFTGGGGGGSSFLPTTGTGTATGDITGELNGHDIGFSNGGDLWWYVDLDTKENSMRTFGDNGDNGQVYIAADSSNKSMALFAQDGNTGNESAVRGDATAQTLNLQVGNGDTTLTKIVLDNSTETITHTADHHNFNLSEFADNAAAVSGGLIAGDLYHTAGTVKIVTP